MKIIVTLGAFLFFGGNVFCNDFRKWPNGGGKVHKDAVVHETAYIDSLSNIDACVSVGAHTILKDVVIRCFKEQASLEVRSGVTLQETSLNLGKGRSVIGSGTMASKFFAEGEFQIRENAIIRDTKADETSLQIRDKSLISNSSFKGKATIRENCTITDSKFSDGVEIRENNLVSHSTFGKNVEVRENSIILHALIKEGTEIRENTILTLE